jgi:hypothetical protein
VKPNFTVANETQIATPPAVDFDTQTKEPAPSTAPTQ